MLFLRKISLSTFGGYSQLLLQQLSYLQHYLSQEVGIEVCPTHKIRGGRGAETCPRGPELLHPTRALVPEILIKINQK